MAASRVSGLQRCLFCARALSKSKNTMGFRNLSILRSALPPIGRISYFQLGKGKEFGMCTFARVDYDFFFIKSMYFKLN